MFDPTVVLQSAAVLFQPDNLAWIAIGFLAGVVVGAIPGLNEGTFLAVVLPLTLYMDPWTALLFMTAVYVAAEMAGSYPAILVNIPGTVGTVATSFEGYPLTQRGLAGEALAASMLSSSFGGAAGALLFLLVGPLIGSYALLFESPEMFMVGIFGLTAIGSLTGGDTLKGLLSGAVGLLLATTGLDSVVGVPRATFGFLEVYDGIPILPALIGFFGFSELLRLIGQEYVAPSRGTFGWFRASIDGAREALAHIPVMLRSTIVGMVIGIVPGTGAATASVVSYGQARQWSRQPEQFGKGSFEGLISCDTANNAAVPGALIPTLALGVPGSGTTVIFLASLLLHGLHPGPGFWEANPVRVNAIGLTIVLCSALICAICIPFSRIISSVSRIPTRLLIPIIATFTIIGVFTYRYFLFDIGLMVVFGVIGWIFKRFQYSAPALLLGIVLGPMIEENFLRSLQLGGVSIFFTKPLSLALLLCTLSALFLPLLAARRRRSKAPREGGSVEA